MSNEYEIAITNTGWGLCHCAIIGLCGMCAIAEAGATLTILIVTPLLMCDLKLDKDKAMFFNATWCFGMMIGGFLFGAIVDASGRKRSIPVTMVIVFCSCISLSFAQTNFLIYLSIFMLGLGLAGSNVVLRVYLIECLPIKRRGTCMAILDLLWIIGYLSALGVAWSLIPSVLRLQNMKFRPTSWRILAGLSGTPSLIMACMASLLPPSPRYLLYRRRQDEALSVLQQIYAINSSKHTDTYRPTDLGNCIYPDEEQDDATDGMIKIIQKFCRKTIQRIRELRNPRCKHTIILGLLICLLHFPGFVWLALWNSQILQEMEERKSSIFLDNISSCTINTRDIANGFLHDCQKVYAERFKFLLLISLSYVIGEILLSAGIDIIGRKAFLVASGIIGAAASFALIFIKRRETSIVLSVIFLAASAISRTAIVTILLENFPTRLRGTVIGLAKILPYFLESLVKFTANVHCLPSIVIVSGLILGTAIAGLPLSDLTQAPMQE